MFEKKQRITLPIAGKPYEVRISRGDEEKEELYRQAAKSVNEYFGKLKEGFDLAGEGCLAMTALHFAIRCLAEQRSRRVGDEEVRALEALSAEVDGYLNSLTAEKTK